MVVEGVGDNNFTQQVVRKPSKATNEEEVSEADRAKHEAMAKEIEAKLQAIQAKPGEAFADFYARIKAEGAKLQTQYQPQLREGIVLTIELINSVKEDEKDGDVDVRVRIRPNDVDEEFEIEGAEKEISFNSGVSESFAKHAFAGNRHADLNLSLDVMVSKSMLLIENNIHLLKTGDNTLVGDINGIQKSFKAFVQNGKIMSINMYPGVSNRVTQGIIINFRSVTW